MSRLIRSLATLVNGPNMSWGMARAARVVRRGEDEIVVSDTTRPRQFIVRTFVPLLIVPAIVFFAAFPQTNHAVLWGRIALGFGLPLVLLVFCGWSYWMAATEWRKVVLGSFGADGVFIRTLLGERVMFRRDLTLRTGVLTNRLAPGARCRVSLVMFEGERPLFPIACENEEELAHVANLFESVIGVPEVDAPIGLQASLKTTSLAMRNPALPKVGENGTAG